MFEGVPEGDRDQRFWRYASSLRGRNVHIEEARGLVEAAWQRADPGHHPFPLETALEQVDRAYAQYEPNEPKAKVLNLRLGKRKLAKLDKQVQAGGDLMGLLSAMAEPGGQAEALVELAEELYDFHQSLEGKPFVVPKGGPSLARFLRGARSTLRAELAATYNERKEGGVPNSEAMSAAMRVIEGRCLRTEPVELHLRLARVGDGIVIDLGDEQGRAVLVKPGEWRHLTELPVIFRRTKLTAPLPLPVPGGGLEELRGLLNVSDRAWPLLVAYLVATLVPDLPHPVLLLRGEQGTGKTTAARLLSRTVTAQTRTAPRDTRSWVISVAGAWVVVLDNLSGIQDWLSDAICRAVTGDGWVDRELYTDEELTVISNRRVVVLNSIDPGALRGDLGDRLVPIELQRIEEADRRLDREIEEAFREVHPRVLGALLDLLARTLEELPEVELEGFPRMADFAKVVAAVDKVRGTEALEVYLSIRDEIAQEVVGGDPVALAVQRFMTERGEWSGTATELLRELDPWPKPEGWPKGPQPLSAALKRAAPSLRQAEEELRVDVGFGKADRSTRLITLRNPKRARSLPGTDQ
jgi:DNA polymerase III delta prime subunit